MQVFVYDSSLAGTTGSGHCLYARQRRGAAAGAVRGQTGKAYAVPTRDEQRAPLSPTDVRAEARAFLEHAAAHPADRFFVANMGRDVARHFRDGASLPNVVWPAEWADVLPHAALHDGNYGRWRRRLAQ